MKIIVYTIMKNEFSNIEPWLENVKDADGIYVLDTGSTDGSYEKMLQMCQTYPQLHVAQHIFDCFRFDDARNANLAMVPNESDIVCWTTDLDERFVEDWYQRTKNIVEVHPHFYKLTYWYACRHNIQGDVEDQHIYDKCHQRVGARWTRPIHEVLDYGEHEQDYFEGNIFMGDDIIIHHWQNGNYEDRSALYCKLLRDRISADKYDIEAMHHLTTEYGKLGDWQAQLDLMLLQYSRGLVCGCTWMDTICGNIAETLSYTHPLDADYWYRRAIEFNPNLRTYYIKYANFLCQNCNPSQPDKALDILFNMEMANITTQEEWKEVEGLHTWLCEDTYGVVWSWKGNYIKALKFFKQAHEMAVAEQSSSGIALTESHIEFCNNKIPKLAVYAICKDEIKHIDRWFEHILEADYITILDTGSTDGTYEKLKEYENKFPDKVHVYQKIIEPFSFCEARNISLYNVPSEYDICMWSDIDEYIISAGWVEAIKNIAIQHPNFNRIALTVRGSDESDKVRAVYGKIHKRNGFYWKSYVHEYLVCTDSNLQGFYQDTSRLWVIHNWGTREEKPSRLHYLDYLNRQIKDHPYDINGYYWKWGELSNWFPREETIEFLKQAQQHFSNIDLQQNVEFMNSDISRYIYDGVFAHALSKLVNSEDEQLAYYKEVIEKSPQIIDPYINVIIILCNRGRVDEAKYYYSKMNEDAAYVQNWFNVDARQSYDAFVYGKDYCAGLIASWCADYKQAYDNFSRALDLISDSSISNADYWIQHISSCMQFCKDKF